MKELYVETILSNLVIHYDDDGAGYVTADGETWDFGDMMQLPTGSPLRPEWVGYESIVAGLMYVIGFNDDYETARIGVAGYRETNS